MFVAMMRFDYQRLNRRWIVYGLLLITIALAGCGVWLFADQRRAALDQVAGLFDAAVRARQTVAGDFPGAYFSQRRAGDEASFWRTFLPCLFVLGIVAGLVVIEPDLGTALMLAIIVFHDLFCGGRAAASPGLCAWCRRCCTSARC